MQESVMQRMWNSGYLSGGNAAYVEELYELYLHDPNAVPEEWRTKFQTLPTDGNSANDVSHSTIRDHFVLLAKNQRRAQPVSAGSVSSEHEKKQVEVLRLIQAYRMRGHQAAQLDPLGLWQRPAPADLSINHYGLTNADLDTTFRAGDLFIGKEEAAFQDFAAREFGLACLSGLRSGPGAKPRASRPALTSMQPCVANTPVYTASNSRWIDRASS